MNLLFELTVRGSVMFAVVALLDWVLGARIRARTRRAWWLLVPMAFLVTVPVPVPVAGLPARLAAVVAPRGWTEWTKVDLVDLVDQMTGGTNRGGVDAARTNPGKGVPVGMLLVVTGAGGYLLTAALRTRSALKRWSGERLCIDAKWLAILEDCKLTAGITAPIGLVVSDAVAAPVIIGWLRPRILLPAELASSLSPGQLRGVLFHELAHFRALDIPVNWLFTAVCAAHWFNPAAHLAFRAWTRFREEAADEAAIAWLGASSALAYGETLLHILRKTNGLPVPMPFAALAIVESLTQLRKRIIMIKNYDNTSARTLLVGAILAAAALCILLHPVRAGEGSDDPKTVATSTMTGWLEEIDGGKYAQSWTDAAPAFQKALTSDAWKAALEKVRTPLGKCTERKLASASKQSALPSPAGAQNGDFILAQFDTSFEGLKYAVETVTFMKAPDGTWKAAGYYIKPKV